MTTTLRTWFANFTERTGEIPTHIVLGTMSWWAVGDEDDDQTWSGINPGKLIKFTDVPVEVLDKEFDDGYGGNNSPDLCAWSKSWVIFSCDYDGSEWLTWVPRRPKAHTPQRPGGG